jgi:hypothetical protein
MGTDANQGNHISTTPERINMYINSIRVITIVTSADFDVARRWAMQRRPARERGDARQWRAGAGGRMHRPLAGLTGC